MTTASGSTPCCLRRLTGGHTWACLESASGRRHWAGWPRSSRPPAREHASASPFPCKPWRGRVARPIRILLADDPAILRDGIRALLSDEGDLPVVGAGEKGR